MAAHVERSLTVRIDIAEPSALKRQIVDDEDLAARSASKTMLITAAIAADVEAVARRIHAAGALARHPFVCVSAAVLPDNRTALEGACANLLDAASGGRLLITNIEDMPAVVQDSLLETFAGLQAARDPSAAVRLIAGTTVNLRDRIANGTFSERLFYRLNVIHIVIPRRSPARDGGSAGAQ